MNPDRFKMQERIKVLRGLLSDAILKNIPTDGNVTHKNIQRCMLDLAHYKSELVGLVTAMNFLQEQDQLAHREHINRG